MTATMTETDDLVTCDGCDAEMSESLYDASNGMCDACHSRRFECRECNEITLKSDAHPTHKTLCESCGDSKVEADRQEALDKAADELRELAEAIIESDDLTAVRKALAALKKLTPK
jgi:hypothetical protein